MLKKEKFKVGSPIFEMEVKGFETESNATIRKLNYLNSEKGVSVDCCTFQTLNDI